MLGMVVSEDKLKQHYSVKSNRLIDITKINKLSGTEINLARSTRTIERDREAHKM